MPKWADLRIYITSDFDIGSGISVAFGVNGGHLILDVNGYYY